MSATDEIEARFREAEAAADAGRWEEANRRLADLTARVAARPAGDPAHDRLAALRRRLADGPTRSAGPDRPATVRRYVAVRYYSRVSPGTAYPMLVVVSRHPLDDGQLEAAVRQSPADEVTFAAAPADVVPVLAGCTVVPPRHAVAVAPDLSSARFEVTAHGSVPRAAVLVQQAGETVATVPLEIRARRTLPSVVCAAAAVLVPVLLKANQLDLENAVADGGGRWRAAVAAVAGVVPWWLFGVVGAAVAGWLYWRSRPRTSTFFDVTTVAGLDAELSDRYDQGRHALSSGDAVRGLAVLDGLTRASPDFQPAWLLTADWHYERGAKDEALARYRRGLALGPSTARRFAQAASAAAAANDLTTALGWLDAGLGLTADGDTALRPLLLYNRACYLARQGEDATALAALAAALAAGFPDPTAVHTDPDLAPLRRLPAFAALVPTPPGNPA